MLRIVGNTIGLAFVLLVSLNSRVHAQTQTSPLWVTAYYAGWMQGWTNNGTLPAQDIDYTAISHLIHFSVVPRSDGTLDSLVNSITTVNSEQVLQRARVAGTKVLISVGGWGSDTYFRSATSPLFVDMFVDNLVRFMVSRGYDGIDVDWEYLGSGDAIQYGIFIRKLRARLNDITPRPLLTAAVAWSPHVLAAVADCFDQINIMTYDLSGAWPGWISWHNSPIYDGGVVFPSTLRPVPSAHGMVTDFMRAGIPREKLGIGVDFYGYVWSGGSGTPTGGVTHPKQTWIIPPFVRPNIPYYRIWSEYYSPEFYRWDSIAQAPYLAIDQPGETNDRFISFCDEVSGREKVRYARDQGLGGVFIWELGGGYLPTGTPDRDRLLQAIKNAVLGIAQTPAVPWLLSPANNDRVPVETTFRWSSTPFASRYRLQVATDSAFTELVLDDSTITTNSHRQTLEHGLTYRWRVSAGGIGGWSPFSTPWRFTTTDSMAVPPSVPSRFALYQNYPNPFNGSTIIRFEIPQESSVSIGVWNLQGKHVATLFNGRLGPGFHDARWSPDLLSSGIYICRMVARTREPQPWNFPAELTIERSVRLLYVK